MGRAANVPGDRGAGLLLHATSLPPAGGGLAQRCEALLDWMVECGLRVWQLLPLGPPGPGCSPYSARSSFAGNTRLVAAESSRERWARFPREASAERRRAESDSP